jgi:hypothetical protein
LVGNLDPIRANVVALSPGPTGPQTPARRLALEPAAFSAISYNGCVQWDAGSDRPGQEMVSPNASCMRTLRGFFLRLPTTGVTARAQ